MFESVARTAPDNPYVRVGRMPIDNEIVVSRVFVLADAGLDQRRIFHPRKTVGKITTRRSQTLFAHQPLA